MTKRFFPKRFTLACVLDALFAMKDLINSPPSVSYSYSQSVSPLVTHFSLNWFINLSDILHEVRGP